MLRTRSVLIGSGTMIETMTRRAKTTESAPLPVPDERVAHWQPFVDGLRGFVARRVPVIDAEDVAQEVLLRLHQQASTLRDVNRAQAWVFGIARRVVADYYRGRIRADESADIEIDSLADPEAGVHESFSSFAGDHSVHEEVLTWLRPIAEGLPSKYRDALLMADFEGRTQREVAASLGLSLSGAKSRVQRARKMLATELEHCCAVEVDAEGRARDFTRNACDC